MSEKSSYSRYGQPSPPLHPHYQLTSGRLGGKRNSVRVAEPDPYAYDSGYESVGASMRRHRGSLTPPPPPPELIQTGRMGSIERPPLRPNTVAPGGGRRFGASNMGVRSGEMGYNQPRILRDGGLGPIVHQGHSASGYQIPHDTCHPAHVHLSGSRASVPRSFSISANPGRYVGCQNERASWREERGYRDDFRDDRGSASSEDSWSSKGRLFPGSVQSSYAPSSTTESFYLSPSPRRFS